MTSNVIRRLKGFDYRAPRTYFVTFCVSDRKPIFADHESCDAAVETLVYYRQVGWYWLNCYCIMPDHIHLLLKLRSKDRSLCTVVALLKRRIKYMTPRTIDWGWQSGFHDRVVRSDDPWKK